MRLLAALALIPAIAFAQVQSQPVKINDGALNNTVTTTPTVLQWYAGTGDTATSLATTDGTDFVTFAVRRVPLATQIFPISTAIGAGASDDIPMRTPLVIESGRYVHIILSVPVGTATASQVIRGTVFINGYFE